MLSSNIIINTDTSIRCLEKTDYSPILIVSLIAIILCFILRIVFIKKENKSDIQKRRLMRSVIIYGIIISLFIYLTIMNLEYEITNQISIIICLTIVLMTIELIINRKKKKDNK